MIDENRLNKPVLFVNFNERDAFEVKSKGWFLAQIALPNGRQVKISFYDPVRLMQEITDELSGGRPCFSEPNLVVIPEVTISAMESALVSMVKSRFFDAIM